MHDWTPLASNNGVRGYFFSVSPLRRRVSFVPRQKIPKTLRSKGEMAYFFFYGKEKDKQKEKIFGVSRRKSEVSVSKQTPLWQKETLCISKGHPRAQARRQIHSGELLERVDRKELRRTKLAAAAFCGRKRRQSRSPQSKK